MAVSFLVTTHTLLPWSISGENPLTSFGTLTDLELRLKTRFSEGRRVEPRANASSLFMRDGAFLCSF